jgi:hypothetical protein
MAGSGARSPDLVQVTGRGRIYRLIPAAFLKARLRKRLLFWINSTPKIVCQEGHLDGVFLRSGGGSKAEGNWRAGFLNEECELKNTHWEEKKGSLLSALSSYS